MRDIQKTAARETDEWRVESLTLLVEPTIRTNLLNCMLNRLNREILHLSRKSRGKVRKFQKPLVVATPGGALGYFLGGYVPPGTPNWHPILKKISPKIDTPF